MATMASKFLGVFLILLVAFATQESMVQKAEAKVCDVLSDKYKGPCIGDSPGCDEVCTKQEHLISGLCKGNFQCYCRKNC